MSWLRQTWSRTKALFGRARSDAEMAEEMRLHLEQRERENLEAGMPPDEARAAARRSFGNAGVWQEAARNERRAGWIEELGRDLKIGLRILGRERAFAGLAIAVLALGICGVTTQFSVVHAIVLRDLPVDEPGQLVSVTVRDPAWPPGRTTAPSSADFVEWTRAQTTFQALATQYTGGSFIVVTEGPAQRVAGGHVSHTFFSLLRVRPALGRDFRPEDDRPLNETPRVAIISDAWWAEEFDRDPAIIGRSFRLNGAPATVIGVMGPEFNLTRDRVWMPMFSEYPPSHNSGGPVIGRLKPGVTAAQAAAEIGLLAQRLAEARPAGARPTITQARVEPLFQRLVDRELREMVLAMLVAVAAVLGIACLNVTNLQFARAAARGRELAVRGALGASRRRLLAQMLTESLLLVALGGGAGVLASIWTTQLLQKLGTSAALAVPPWVKFELNGPVLAATLGAAALSVVLAGLLPAWFASGANPVSALRDGGRGQTGRFVHRLTRALVTGQIALTCALLVASLLLIRSIVNKEGQSLGYDGSAVLQARINLETEFRRPEEIRDYYPRLLEAVRAAPGVTAAALTSRRNLRDTVWMPFQIEGMPPPAGPNPQIALRDVVSDGYFATLGVRVLAGREFRADDGLDPQRPVVLVNASFVRQHLGGSEAVGRRLRPDSRRPWATIVGVVPDTLMQGPSDPDTVGAGIFEPLAAQPQTYVTLMARGPGAPEAMVAPLRQAVAKTNPNVALYAITTPAAGFADVLLPNRVAAGAFALFALVAIALATVGLYGVTAFAVHQRMHEFGIRAALGADARALRRAVLRGGAGQLALGLALGAGAALALTRLGGAAIGRVLFRVDPHDPLVYLAVAGLLAAATLVACLAPARRAARVDPMVALRAE